MKHGLFTKKKILCLGGLVLGALLLFVCCETLPGDTSTDEEKVQDGGEGALISEYILVRGDSSGNEVLRQVLELKSAIDDRFGTDARSSTDWAVDAESSGEVIREILVGETNRAESIAVNSELEGVNGYVICTVGDKLVISASTTGLLKQAVELFTNEYIENSEDGTMPAQINIRRTVENPLGVMSDESCMRVVLSNRASGGLRRAANDFADRIFELSAVRPQIEFSPELSMEKIVCTFKDPVFASEEDDRDTEPEAQGNGIWSINREGDQVVLEAESEVHLIAGLAGFYETLEKRSDRTLDGKTVFFYNRGDSRNESWQSVLPRLVGGVYLGRESIASNCNSLYYDNVSLNDLCAWKLLILEENFGPWQTVTNTGDYAQYVNYGENLEITVFYNSDAKSLYINERQMS